MEVEVMCQSERDDTKAGGEAPTDRNPDFQEPQGAQDIAIDRVAERNYLWKLDLWLLPFLSMMYFFNAIDRNNLANAETDGLSTDLHFAGQQYSLLVLLFYIPNGLCDLPLNILTKRFSGKIMLPLLMTGWGALSMLQVACTSFAGILVVRLLLAALEAGFFAGSVFYLTLFYQRDELAFRIALFFGSALLAGAFSGLLAFGVFQIPNPHVKGWMWLFMIEGGATVLCGIAAFFWLPATPSSAWFLSDAEKAIARARDLRDGAGQTEAQAAFRLSDCFRDWNSPLFAVWCGIAITYPVAFSTTANFLPLILRRLGYSTVLTNLLTVPPNVVGFVVLLCVARSSDVRRERSGHLVAALATSLAGLVLLAVVPAGGGTGGGAATARDVGAAYFACFLLCSGAYVPSCLVHSWHNNNNVGGAASRAATTGLLVGLGNLGGVVSGATFRAEYAPRYVPCLVATAACNVVCMALTAGLGAWMRRENRRRDRAQKGVRMRAGQEVAVRDREALGTQDPAWRYFV